MQPMTGLMGAAGPQQEMPAAEQDAGAPQDAGTQQGEAVQKLVLAGMKTIYEEGVTEELVQMMKSGNPAQGLANATLTVMRELTGKAQGEVPPEMLYVAGKEIMRMIAEIGEAAKVFKSSPQLLQQSEMIAVGELRKQAGVTPEQIDERMQQMGGQPNQMGAQPQQQGLLAGAQ